MIPLHGELLEQEAHRAHEPGTSVRYDGGKPWHRFLRWYPIASLVTLAVNAGVLSILLPNQVQEVVSKRYFTGDDAGTDLTKLQDLSRAVKDGATVTADQHRLLDLFHTFDADRAQALSLVVALATLGPMLAQPIVGVLSDRTRSRLGRRAPWFVVGGLGAAVCLIALRSAGSFGLIMVSWGLGATLVAVATSPLQAVVADRVPEEKLGFVSGVGGLGSLFGGVFGALLAGVLFSTLRYDLYLILAALLVAGLLGISFRSRDTSSRALVVDPFDWGAFFRGFLVPLRDHDFRLVFVARAVLFFGGSISSSLGFLMLQSYIEPGLSAKEATELVPLLAISALPLTLIGMAVSGWLSDKIGRRKPFVIAASLCMALSMLIPLTWPTLPALWTQGVLAALALGIYIPVDQALFIDVLPDRAAAGRDLGIANMATSIGSSVGPILAGQIVAFSGGYRLVWATGLAVALASALVVIPVRGAR